MYLFIRWLGLVGLLLTTMAEGFTIPQVEIDSLPPLETLTPEILKTQQHAVQQLSSQLDDYRQVLHQHQQRLAAKIAEFTQTPQAVTIKRIQELLDL